MNKYNLCLKNKDAVHPQPLIPSLCFIKNVVKNPNIIVGGCAYYDDASGVYVFEIDSGKEICGINK